MAPWHCMGQPNSGGKPHHRCTVHIGSTKIKHGMGCYTVCVRSAAVVLCCRHQLAKEQLLNGHWGAVGTVSKPQRAYTHIRVEKLVLLMPRGQDDAVNVSHHQQSTLAVTT